MSKSSIIYNQLEVLEVALGPQNVCIIDTGHNLEARIGKMLKYLLHIGVDSNAAVTWQSGKLDVNVR